MWLFLLHNTTHHHQALFQNRKSSSCGEIFDRKSKGTDKQYVAVFFVTQIFDRKKFTNKQTNKQIDIVTEKAKNYIPPIYFIPGV